MQKQSKRRLLKGAALAVLSVIGLTAFAEKADRDKPINITADRGFEDNKKQEAVFEGNVLLTQGTLRIDAARVVVRRDKDGFDFATATGAPARFRQKRDGSEEYVEGHAQRIEYDGKQEIVQFLDRAQVKRGPNEITGNYIEYNSQTEVFQAFNPGQKTAASDGGRVRAVIQPKPKNPPPATQKPTDVVKP
ncbi:MAG: lipopolysaccharide transport periplasmic protein LptA [Burkholderiales bacterium]|nr:lipopolysaccharide transport periplasmic protein LptA [Burkholderiales bacterium]